MTSYAAHVRAHEKSVVLGGARELFPVNPAVTQQFARTIAETIKIAEAAAYERGVKDARAAVRRAIGL